MVYQQTLDGFVRTRERNRFGVSLPLGFAIGIYALITTHASVVLRDPDTLWHIAVGRWIIEHGAVPSHGIFSATMANAPWVDQEWLAEVLMAWGYDHLGWFGLVAGTALCEAAAIAILLRVLLGVLTPLHALFAAILAGGLSSPHLLARPYILTMSILVVWVAALVRARNENRAPSLWFVLLIALWANLHGSFVFALGIAALLAAEAVLVAQNWPARVRVVRDWGCFGLLALGAALATPFGFEGLLFPFHLTNMSALGNIGEWQGVNFSQPWSMTFEVWLLVILFAALTLGWRLPPTRVGMVILLLAMTLKHLRYMELLGPVSALLLAPSLALQFSRRSSAATGIDRLMAELAQPATWRGIVTSGVILLAVSMIASRGRHSQPAEPIFPAAAVAEVQSQHIRGPVFNAYGFGGYLVFSGIEPFIDGRAELYGDDFVNRYIEASHLTNNQLPQLLNDNGIAWTIFQAKTPVAVFMDYLPGWRRLYADSVAVVHIRQP
jgi:hypothetical protein